MKWFIILCVVGIGTWFASDYLVSIEKERARRYEEMRIEKIAAEANARSLAHQLRKMIHAARALEEWQHAASIDLSSLAPADRSGIEAVIKGGVFEALFWQGETLLARARGLLEQDENHPAAAQYLARARALYENLASRISGLEELPDAMDWNFRVQYLKGIFFFRKMAFAGTEKESKQEISDLVAQSLAHLDKALALVRHDRDTQVAIEVLRKKAEHLLGQWGSLTTKMRLELLPSKDREVGAFQMGPREEGRH